MTPLEGIVRDEIAQRGPLSVARYMALCLGHPRHGYYMTRQPFGAEGDFLTAPEACQIFGELTGLWVMMAWQGMGAPDPFHLVELGPGRGVLMADMLRAMGVLPDCRKAVRVHLVETSPRLRAEQQKTLAGSDVSLRWHGEISTLPEGPVIVVANEFFDALPVHHYERVREGWRERMVVVDASGALGFAAVGDVLAEVPDWAADLPVGAVIELSPERRALAGALGARLAACGGAFLTLDYGHVHPGPGETLQAVHGHEKVDVFFRPGMSDLTAHVDFSALGAALAAGGLKVCAPMTQGEFLLRMGLRERLDALLKTARAEQARILRKGAERIAGPKGMGQLFKALAAVPAGMACVAPFREMKG